MRKVLSRQAVLLIFPILFLILLSVVGVLLQQRIRTMFHTYVEQEVAMNTDMLANRLDARFGAELMGMENLIQVKGTDSWESLLAARKTDGTGIKRMGVLAHRGRAIVGDSLKVGDWDGIRQSFQGHLAISYARGKGLLLTVPIHRRPRSTIRRTTSFSWPTCIRWMARSSASCRHRPWMVASSL